MRHFLNRATAFLRPKYDIIWMNEHFCISSTSLFQWALPNQNRCGYCKSSLCLTTPNFSFPDNKKQLAKQQSEIHLPQKTHQSHFFEMRRFLTRQTRLKPFTVRFTKKKFFSGLKRKIKYSSFHNQVKAVLHQGWTGCILYCPASPLPSRT